MSNSNFSKFMKSNKKVKENVEYQATASLLDDNGEPLKWVIKPLTPKEHERIREDCSYDAKVPGKPNQVVSKIRQDEYMLKVMCKSIVYPNLHDKELQDSYGVMTPEELLQCLIDDLGEYYNFSNFIMDYNGFNKSIAEKIEQAKN